MLFHVLVAIVLGKEFGNGRLRLFANGAKVPAIEGKKRHDDVHEHEQRKHRRDDIAAVPGNHIDELKDSRQACAHPPEPQQSPANHVRDVGAPVEVKGFTRIIPGQDAKCKLEEPAHREFECAADNRGSQKGNDDALLAEAVERNRKQHGAHAIDGTEGSPQHAGSVFEHARIQNWANDAFHHKAKNGRDHENPEQIEEVERDVAFARLVEAKGSLLGIHLVLKLRLLDLLATFFHKRRIEVGGHNEHEDEGSEVP